MKALRAGIEHDFGDRILPIFTWLLMNTTEKEI